VDPIQKDAQTMRKKDKTTQDQGLTRKAFLETAKRRGVQVYKNNVHLAKPLSEVCGNIRIKHKDSLDQLLCHA
jgi:hypothetical protein